LRNFTSRNFIQKTHRYFLCISFSEPYA